MVSYHQPHHDDQYRDTQVSENEFLSDSETEGLPPDERFGSSLGGSSVLGNRDDSPNPVSAFRNIGFNVRSNEGPSGPQQPTFHPGRCNVIDPAFPQHRSSFGHDPSALAAPADHSGFPFDRRIPLWAPRTQNQPYPPQYVPGPPLNNTPNQYFGYQNSNRLALADGRSPIGFQGLHIQAARFPVQLPQDPNLNPYGPSQLPAPRHPCRRTDETPPPSCPSPLKLLNPRSTRNLPSISRRVVRPSSLTTLGTRNHIAEGIIEGHTSNGQSFRAFESDIQDVSFTPEEERDLLRGVLKFGLNYSRIRGEYPRLQGKYIGTLQRYFRRRFHHIYLEIRRGRSNRRLARRREASSGTTHDSRPTHPEEVANQSSVATSELFDSGGDAVASTSSITIEDLEGSRSANRNARGTNKNGPSHGLDEDSDFKKNIKNEEPNQ